MLPLITKFSPILPQHYEILRSHMMCLNGDDRYQRFGSAISNDAIDKWIKTLSWDKFQLFGAWRLDYFARPVELIGVLQLVPMNTFGSYELAMTVLQAYRRRGIATAMVSTAIKIESLQPIKKIICQNGHPVMRSIVRTLELDAHYQNVPPKMHILCERPTQNKLHGGL